MHMHASPYHFRYNLFHSAVHDFSTVRSSCYIKSLTVMVIFILHHVTLALKISPVFWSNSNSAKLFPKQCTVFLTECDPKAILHPSCTFKINSGQFAVTFETRKNNLKTIVVNKLMFPLLFLPVTYFVKTKIKKILALCSYFPFSLIFTFL